MISENTPGREGPFDLRSGYGVELLYPATPPLDPSTLAARVQSRRPLAQAVAGGDGAPILFAHQDHVVPLAGVSHERAETTVAVAAKTLVMPGEGAGDIGSLFKALDQTRDWDGAVEAVARCTVRVVVTDWFARELEPRERLKVFEDVLLGVIETAPPTAIHWRPAGKLVDPAAFLRADGSPDCDDLPSAALNVRLFKVKGSPDRLLMDTLGLWPLGLPDAQIIFRADALPPARVAAHLFACALHVLKHGDCLADGEAIEGPSRGQTWQCRHGASAAAPARTIIDFDPDSHDPPSRRGM